MKRYLKKNNICVYESYCGKVFFLNKWYFWVWEHGATQVTHS